MIRTDIDRDFAFFCVADGRGYVPKVVTTLCSIRRFHPDAAYFVVGRFTEDAPALELISRHGLQFQYLDLSGTFRDCVFVEKLRPEWPSECFWWTYAYKLFAERGYRFCGAFDGDVLCVSPLALETVLDVRSPISGVAKPNGRINSGVLFLNNEVLIQMRFFERIVEIYDNVKVCDHPQCNGYCREKGDQGLLWEMTKWQGLTPKILENAYNHMLAFDEVAYLERNPAAPFGVEDSRLLHLLSKPWRPLPRGKELYPVALAGYRTWWRFVEELWPNPAERECFFGSAYGSQVSSQ